MSQSQIQSSDMFDLQQTMAANIQIFLLLFRFFFFVTCFQYKKIKNRNIRSKLPQKEGSYPKRNIPGMEKCGKHCLFCPYIKVGKKLKENDFMWFLNKSLHCKSDTNIIYMIECSKPNCKARDIGETEILLHDCLCEHI